MFSALKSIFQPSRKRIIVHLCQTQVACDNKLHDFLRYLQRNRKAHKLDSINRVVRVGDEDHLYRSLSGNHPWWAGLEIDAVRVEDPRITVIPPQILSRVRRGNISA